MATILIIDDEPLLRRYMRDILVAAGHSVREATEGNEALALVQADEPDLVVCDLFMPGREGIETVREIRRLAPTIPIVVVSGGGRWDLLESLQDAAWLGATLALPKPLQPRVLLEAIGEFLEGRPPSPPGCCEAARRAAGGGGEICPSLRTCPQAGSSVWCGARRRVVLAELPVNS